MRLTFAKDKEYLEIITNNLNVKMMIVRKSHKLKEFKLHLYFKKIMKFSYNSFVKNAKNIKLLFLIWIKMKWFIKNKLN